MGELSSQLSAHDEYGFIRPDTFDLKVHEDFMSHYLRVMARRRGKWETLLSKGYNKLESGSKLKRYIRKGVPAPHRKGVWMQVSRAAKMKVDEPDLYSTMLSMTSSNKVIIDQIVTDIPRTFPNNVHFDGTNPNSLQGPLFNILKAFANNNPRIGYCQGLNYIAGLLLLVTRCEDSSFWLLKVLCEEILPEYYTASMPGLLTDMRVLSELARTDVPDLASHIDKLGLPWALFGSKWFICVYSEVLPTETVLRIWDTIFYEGSKIIFRVALGLLKINQSRLLTKNDFAALATEFKEMVDCKVTVNCHTFLEEIYDKTGPLPRSRIDKLRTQYGMEIREEQMEREKRRREDGSGMRDG